MTPTEVIIATACGLLLLAMAAAAIIAGRRWERRLELYRLADLWAAAEDEPPNDHRESVQPLTGDLWKWESDMRREDRA